MSKKIRVVLYLLSILTLVGLLVIFVMSGKENTQPAAVEITENEGDESKQPNSGAEGDESKQPDDGAEGDELKQPNNGAEGDELKQPDDGDNGDESEAETVMEEIADTEEETASTEEEIADTKEVTADSTMILFTGDVLFANAFKAGYDANGIAGVFSGELLQELKDADILMINNEFPFSDRGVPMADKQFTFRRSPSYVTALNEMGVDVVSLANNHTLDYGKEALRDTFAALDKAGIRYGGAGDSVERAEELQIIEVNGKKFGFLAVSRVIPVADWKVEHSTPGIFSCYDETRLVELVAEAKKECDFVAVYPHWGVEYAANPEDYQTKIAEKCIAAGADVIVGSHTHCLQEIEYINGKPVFYSLGNFVFGRDIDKSVVLKVTVSRDGEALYELLPVYAAGGVTQFAAGEHGVQILDYLNRISPGASISTDGTVTDN